MTATGRWTLRLGTASVALVVGAAALATITGALALFWFPEEAVEPAGTAGSCTDPPCFGGDGLPSLRTVPFILHVPVLGSAMLVGGLALLAALVSALRGDRRWVVPGVAALVGPVFVLVAGEVVPHLVNPCTLPAWLGTEPPGFCVSTPEGVDVPDDWHLLDHALVGFLPAALVVLWWWRRQRFRQRDTVVTMHSGGHG